MKCKRVLTAVMFIALAFCLVTTTVPTDSDAGTTYVADMTSPTGTQSYESLQNALDAYTASTETGNYTIKLLSDIVSGDKYFKLEQFEDKNLTIDGLKSDGTKVKFTGQFVVDANSDYGSGETLEISNINFIGIVSVSTFEPKVFIWSGCTGGYVGSGNECQHNGNDVTRYAHNVTISDCVFILEDDHIPAKFKQRVFDTLSS